MSCHEPVKAHGSLVACAYCPGCRSRRSATWALRLSDEERQWDQAAFLTLTVADYPSKAFRCFDRPVPWALNRRYLQLFFKLLRRRGIQFKYYAVGEYGEKEARAHYHVLIFGDRVRDREVLEECWPWGQIDIGRVEEASIRYVTGYVMKAPLGRLRLHAERNQEAPPFSVISRGVGSRGAARRRHTITTQGVVRIGSRAVVPPRFYLSQLCDDDKRKYLLACRARKMLAADLRVAKGEPYVVNNVLDRAQVSRADFNARQKPRGSL